MTDKKGFGEEPVHIAASNGDCAELRRLLDEDPQRIEARGWMGLLPLHYAARSGSLECVKLLLERGADVNAKCLENKSTAIFEASTGEVAELLIQHGALLNLETASGRVALDYAVQGLHASTVRVLLAHGVDVKYKKKLDCFDTMLQWPLVPSSYENCDQTKMIEVLLPLLEAGADPNEKNVFTVSALDEACRFGLIEVVRLFLRYGGNPNLRDMHNQTAFDKAAENAEILALLEPHRKDIPIVPKDPQTPQQLIARLIKCGEVEESEFIPCTDEDIQMLEKEHEVILPESYKSFLRRMGKGAGAFLIDDQMSVFYKSLKRLGTKVEPDDYNNVPLPSKSFIFVDRLSSTFLYFVADGSSEDPPIFSVSELGEIKEVFKSFWGFFEDMVQYYEFYRDPENFSQNR